jgi:hypothetical protein
MEPSKFDELTKALATSTSRRQALKTIAATTIGGILGLGGIGSAFAKNMTCAQWCAAVFGDNTPADEQCSADAAHHTGLCYSCGPQSPGGGVTPSSICCTRTSSGYCTSYSSATCCGSSATCLNGSCCANANVCGSTCLAAPCDSSQCLKCDPTTGACVSTCTSTQTCIGGTCCENAHVCGSTCCDACSTCQGGTCVSSCASGQSCCNGTCSDCPCGYVKLCNGTCAKPCPEGSTCSCGACDFDNDFQNFYCTSGFVGGFCTSDCDCPTGLFCVVTQSCWAAC